ncbi:cytochrome P450 [Aquincola tertiaricarbonis]|uniref:cytochrome P450 n=1 Tax=Aquincola tertiaricarbonis TaxID=391953 RepID=UPI000697F93A|nr:cytochrome P450 [Aquincola tertiaricarbonis]
MTTHTTPPTASRPIPRDPQIDSSLALMADPYRFIGSRCREHGTDVFEARLLLRPTLCLTGPEAARLFYDEERFARRGAAPEALEATLFGQGGVQGLDGERHRHRKALFVSLCGPQPVQALAQQVRETWRRTAAGWRAGEPVVLYAAAQEVFTRAVCAWAGVPLPEAEVKQRTQQLSLLFDGAGAMNLQHLRSRRARQAADAWATGLVEAVRSAGVSASTEATALERIASHREADGELLPAAVAGVELLNLLRPTVAVAVYAVLAAHALHQQPGQREALLGAPPADQRMAMACFVHEVRRYYPFFPAVAARTRRAFTWNGYAFPAGRRVLLDLYGTNHDARAWQTPGAFRPERFRPERRQQPRPGSEHIGPPEQRPFGFVPQGGGEAEVHHRCPGEGIAESLMTQTLQFLLHELHYSVPVQDLSIDMSRLPALPRDRMLLLPQSPVLR